MADTPTITVDFVQSADHPVGGMGEAAIGPILAAVANAVFTLTGQRLRELPLRLEAVSSWQCVQVSHPEIISRREGFVDLSFETACKLRNLRRNSHQPIG
jgi:hypothetical protein